MSGTRRCRAWLIEVNRDVTEACLLATEQREYLSPRQTIVGDGSSMRVGESLLNWGVRRGTVAVIADRVVAEGALVDPVLAGLRASGFHPVVFADIAGEPTVDMAEAALDFVRRSAAGAVVGIGGGSAMDVAKIVALAAGSGGSVTDYLGADAAAEAAMTLALVPTTAGTGAEVTRISMLSDGGRKVISSNRLLVPTVAVLDAELIVSLPSAVTAATGMDALAHAIEAYLSTNRSALSIDASLRAIRLIRDALPRAVHHGDDLEARRATLYGSHFAGLALNAGVVLGHSLAYTIANRRPLSHGVTCAMALPYCVVYNADAPIPGVDQLASVITGGTSTRLVDAADYLADFAQSLDLPSSLRAVGIGSDQIRPMVQECIDRYPRPNNPVPFEEEPLTALVGAFHEGDLAQATSVSAFGGGVR